MGDNKFLTKKHRGDNKFSKQTKHKGDKKILTKKHTGDNKFLTTKYRGEFVRLSPPTVLELQL
jgi:hypothetical protein